MDCTIVDIDVFHYENDVLPRNPSSLTPGRSEAPSERASQYPSSQEENASEQPSWEL